jgi:hypothetical protein
MADVTKTSLVWDSSVAPTANDGAATQSIVLNGKDEKLAFRVYNGDEASVTVTVNSGDGIRSVLGDYVGVVGPAATKYFGPYDSMRFKDTGDGNVQVDITGATTVSLVKLEVVELP